MSTHRALRYAIALVVLGLLAWGGWQLFVTWGWLLIDVPDHGIDITVTVDNRTAKPLGPLVIRDSKSGVTRTIESVAARGREAIRFTVPDVAGEDHITMTDSVGRAYVVAGYFENRLGGAVDIQVDRITPDGPVGRIRERISYPGSWEWRPWGAVPGESG